MDQTYPEAVYGYIRVSSLREEKKGRAISPETQEHGINKWCNEHSVKLLGIDYDLNVSGSREKFMARKILPLIEKVRNDIDGTRGIIVYNVSRWGRSQLESMLSESELKEAGGILLSATEPNDTTSSAGEFSRSMLHAVSAFQRNTIRDSWKSAHESRIRKGLPKDGRPRFGYIYVRDDKGARFEVDSERGPLLAQAYRTVIAGGKLWKVAGDFQRSGITGPPDPHHPNATPELVTYMQLHRALRSGFGAGLLISDSKSDTPTWIQGSHDPVITTAEWEEYKAKEYGSTKRKGPTSNASPLKDLVFCGCCKRKMTSFHFRGQPRLKCPARAHRVSGETDRLCEMPTSVNKAAVEQAVREWLRSHSAGDPRAEQALMARQLKAMEIKTDVEALTAKLTSVENYKLNLARTNARGKLTDDEYDILRQEAEAEEAALKTEIASAQRTIRVHLIPPPDAFDAILEAWERGIADPGMLNTALKHVIRGVYVGRGRTVQSMRKFDIVAAWEDREPEVKLEEDDEDPKKFCPRCKQWLPHSAYYRRITGRAAGSLSSWCQECVKKYMKQQYQDRKAAAEKES